MTTRQLEQEKCYDPRDTTLKFVNRKDEITGDDYVSLRAEMSCGHAATPESVTGWCYELLRQKQYRFTCPADKNGKRCGAEWTFQEVCKMARLTTKEMQEFEQIMLDLHLAQQEIKQCPGCRSYLKRSNPYNLNVRCTTCSAITGQPFEFCWQCMNQWKGPQPRADRCDNHNCTNETLELLKNCPVTSIFGHHYCPSIRACPTCGTVVWHKKTGCKFLPCPTCRAQFCFVCLKLKIQCAMTSSCSVAPRQASIPTRSIK